jgi:hypothetical protein
MGRLGEWKSELSALSRQPSADSEQYAIPASLSDPTFGRMLKAGR